MACVGLLLLQISTALLPQVVVLRYLTTTRLVLLAGLVLLAAARAVEGRGQEPRRLPTATLAILAAAGALLAWSAVSALASGSAASLSSVRLQAEEILAGVLVLGLMRSEEDLASLGFAALLATAVVACHALSQFVNGENTHFFLVHSERWQTVESLAAPAGAITRVVGYFRNPNVLATHLVLVAPFAAVLLHERRVSGWVLAMLGLLGVTALALTFSRAGLVALAVALAIALSRRQPWLALPAVPVVAAILGSPFSTGRLSTVVSRLGAWWAAGTMIADHPWLGVGPGNFRQYATERLQLDMWHAHNLPLHIAAETGILGGALMLTVIAASVAHAVRLSSAGGMTGLAARALTVSFIAFAIVSSADNAYNTMAVSYAFWILVGILLSLPRIRRTSEAAALSGTRVPQADAMLQPTAG